MSLTKLNYLPPQVQSYVLRKHLSLLARLSYDLSFDLMENYDMAEEDEENS